MKKVLLSSVFATFLMAAPACAQEATEEAVESEAVSIQEAVATQEPPATDEVLASIREERLCVIRVDGVPLIPANFAERYVKKATSVATDAGERQARKD